MFLAFKSIRSGSSGNLYLLKSEDVLLAIDMGLRSQRQILTTLAEEGLSPGDLTAVVVSHTHGDHISYSGMRVCEEYGIPMYLPGALINEAIRIYAAKAGRRPSDGMIRGFAIDRAMVFGNVRVSPFVVPHDVVPTVGFRFGLEGVEHGPEIAMATDLGFVPGTVLRNLANTDLLVIESNYDPALLKASPRWYMHKQRVAGRKGHLSNTDSAKAVVSIASFGKTPDYILLAHLSADHNTPELAYGTMKRYVTPIREDISIIVAGRDKATQWITLF